VRLGDNDIKIGLAINQNGVLSPEGELPFE